MSVDHRTMLAQIGRANLAAISGLRFKPRDNGVTLPVAYGYSVEIDYDHGTDTYTVRRVFTRAGKRWIKGERHQVYCDQLGEVAYKAHCFRDPDPFSPPAWRDHLTAVPPGNRSALTYVGATPQVSPRSCIQSCPTGQS